MKELKNMMTRALTRINVVENDKMLIKANTLVFIKRTEGDESVIVRKHIDEVINVEYKVPTSILQPSRIHMEVRNDYTDPDTGYISIDAFKTSDDNEEGVVLALVSPDGKVFLGPNAAQFEDDISCLLVQESICEALDRQEEFKQELVDKVIDSLKEQMEVVEGKGDFTVLEELLKMLPCKNLMQSLDEEEWEEYPTDFALTNEK